MTDLKSPLIDVYHEGGDEHDHEHDGKTESRLDFENVSFEINNRLILHNLSGSLGPSKLIAILGASGAGKTTFLHMLAGKLHGQGHLSGKLKLNGVELDRRTTRKSCSYVQQHDSLYPTLTPREALWDVVNLKLPDTVNPRRKVGMVERTLHLLGLEACADVPTGTPEGNERGLSGGQRKRLSIALEIVVPPKLLLLDEPTSGLDTASAFACVSALKKLSQEGRTIVCTIHQPSSRLFQLFDEVILLGHGEIIFQGPVKGIVEFFGAQGLECPKHYNPADFIVETVEEQPNLVLSKVIAASKQLNDATPKREVPPFEYPKQRYPVTQKLMFQILLKRAFKNLLRDKLTSRMRVASHIMVAIVTGILWYNIDPMDIQNVLGLLFFVIIFLLLNAVIPTVLTFPLQRAIFEKEHHNNWYALRPFFIAQSVADVPLQVVLPCIYGVIVFFMTNLSNDPNYRILEFLITLVLEVLVAQSIGIFVSVVAPNPQFAVFAAPVSLIPQILFCGFLANLKSMPVWISWIQYLSFLRYSVEMIFVSQLKDTPFEGFLETKSFSADTFARNVGVMIIFLFGLRFLAYVILRTKIKQTFQIRPKPHHNAPK